ncbi:MAG: CvpA family protein [Bacilli bacterium]|jgi:uncharacterized membrane protein required for colicin V production
MTWTWDYITLVYVAVMLVFIIIGYVKGFSKGIIALVGTLVSFFLAFFLSKPIGNALYAQWGGGLTTSIDNAIVSKVPSLGEPISTTAEAAISGALTSIGIPSAIQGMITPSILKLIPEGASDIILATYISESLSNLIFIIGSFIVIFLLGMIVFAILKAVMGKLVKSVSLIRWVDKALGVLTFGCVGVLIIAVISYCLTFAVTMNNSVGNWIVSQLHLNDETIMTPSKWIYEYNLLQRLFNLYLA